MKEKGPSYGYYPKPTKTHLILKNPDQLQRAEDLFAVDGVKITVEGNRHIGAVLGTDAYKEQYITEKIEKWIADVKELASIAKEEPQAALSAFNTGLSQRWTFVQRTIEGIAPMFLPLEDVIRNELIPAVCGRGVSDIERRLIALPYRWGGLGIQNPALTAEREYRTSVRITSGLTALICQQEMDISLLDEDEMKTTKQELKNEKEDLLKAEFESITEGMSDKLKKTLISAQEKGSSSWLSSLPIKKLGYTLNKQEFRDAVCLRYGWPIANTPIYCACGKKNSVDHILTCKKGGYVAMRHNSLRDNEANLMREVCKDVRIEPELMPVERDVFRGNQAPNARLDISARGVWSPCEKHSSM